MSSAGSRVSALLAFLLIGGSFVLQLINSISLPYIHGLYFLRLSLTELAGRPVNASLDMGIWTMCLNGVPDSGCAHPYGLGYRQAAYHQFFATSQGGLNLEEPLIKNLPYALVLQPIAAGFTLIATLGALISVCSAIFLWPFLALWAALVSIAALVIELVLFIRAHDRLVQLLDATRGNFGDVSIKYGPALWIQVAATAAVVVGCLFLMGSYLAAKSDSVQSGNYVSSVPPSEVKADSYYGYRDPAPPAAAGAYRRGYDTPYEQPAATYPSAVVPGAPPVSSAGAGRAYEPVAYEPRAPEPTHHERRRSHPQRRQSISKSERLDRAEPDYVPRRSYEYDYDYDAAPRRRRSLGQTHSRRAQSDAYPSYANEYTMGLGPTRRASRLYGDRGASGQRYSRSSIPRWQRYEDRGMF